MPSVTNGQRGDARPRFCTVLGELGRERTPTARSTCSTASRYSSTSFSCAWRMRPGVRWQRSYKTSPGTILLLPSGTRTAVSKRADRTPDERRVCSEPGVGFIRSEFSAIAAWLPGRSIRVALAGEGTMKTYRLALACASTLLVAGCGVGGSDGSAATAPIATKTTTPAPKVEMTSPAPPTTAGPTTVAPTSAPPEVPTTIQPTGAERLTVTHVVDGDTVDVSDGSRIRLIGIDTPERGDCGYSEATRALEGLVLGKQITLVPGAQSNSDRYGRLLRYLDLGSTDNNLEMIRAGYAITRYDSRDGYGRHTRQDSYVAADDASPPEPQSCESAAPPPSTVTPSPPSPPSSGVYRNCAAVRAAGAAPIYRGQPGYASHLDGDDDGVGCE